MIAALRVAVSEIEVLPRQHFSLSILNTETRFLAEPRRAIRSGAHQAWVVQMMIFSFSPHRTTEQALDCKPADRVGNPWWSVAAGVEHAQAVAQECNRSFRQLGVSARRNLFQPAKAGRAPDAIDKAGEIWKRIGREIVRSISDRERNSSMIRDRVLILGLSLVASLTVPTSIEASTEPCNQSLIDHLPPATAFYIYPRALIQPFYQWENNYGYCGEVSLMEAGLANGEWMSQYDARLLCGTGLGQSGPPANNDKWCRAKSNQNTANYNAQVLFEIPDTGVSGTTERWGSMPQCAANMRLAGISYPYKGVAARQPPSLCTGTKASTACPGYQAYMSWVKRQVIDGNTVVVALIIKNDTGDGDQYDHEAPVVKIGTNHSPTDPTYYPDDVLYFEDHGVYWYNGKVGQDDTAPEPPPGSGSNTTECTPYIFGYTFSELGVSTVPKDTQATHAWHVYSIVLPANYTIPGYPGANGKPSGAGSYVKITGPNNFAFAVTGVLDTYKETVPVALTAGSNPGSIVGPTYTNGVQNPQDPIAGYDYEYPFIGTSIEEEGPGSCTNKPPSSWMTNFVLQPTVSGLTPGISYNLYEYQFNTPSDTDTLGAGTGAALKVPITAFNANSVATGSTPANGVTSFTASGSTYLADPLATTSDQMVVYRAVPADPGLYSPVNGSTLNGTSETFAWDSATTGPDAGATFYRLDAGKEQGGHEYYRSGRLSNATFSLTVDSLPSDTSTVWVRWYYFVKGQWQYNDYSYTASR